jgi:hypothetical protein
VNIEFGCLEPGKRASVSWRANEPHIKIFVNVFFKERFETVDVQSLERKIIIVSIAFAILHQLAHLFCNWLSEDGTSDFIYERETGSYFEDKIFDHKLHVMVENLKDRQKWTREMEVKGNIMF